MLEILIFILNVAFYFWFGKTMNSINEHLAKIEAEQSKQTQLLASAANDLDLIREQAASSRSRSVPPY